MRLAIPKVFGAAAASKGVAATADSGTGDGVSTFGVAESRLDETGTLVVHLKGAAHLKTGDIWLLGGRSDAYVVVSAAGGRRCVRSSTAKSGLTPAWDEELSIETEGRVGGGSPVVEEEEVLTLGDLLASPLELSVYDRDTGRVRELFSRSDDLIGAFTASIHSVHSHNQQAHTCTRTCLQHRTTC